MLKEKARIFQALSDQNRLRVLKMLSGRTLCVCEITAVLKLAASTVSKHLSILRDAGFIIEEKKSKWVYYRLNTGSRSPLVVSLLTLLNYELSEDATVKGDCQLISSADTSELCIK